MVQRESSDDRQNEDEFALNTTFLLPRLKQLLSADSIELLRSAVADLQEQIRLNDGRFFTEFDDDPNALDPTDLNRELDQIAASRTLGRAQYYLDRLIKGITEVKTSPINDINLNRWKAYGDIITDSLWVIDRRDSSGAHTAGYWGNFVPQIPRQMMLRYTKRGEWVLDPFVGCGTTAIEGQRLGRHTIGVELQPDVASLARRLVASEPNRYNAVSDIITGDSRTIDFDAVLGRHAQKSVQLVIMHPPYFDIIKFSDDPRDLSNSASISNFLGAMGFITEKVGAVLDPGRYLVLVIGDKYASGEWIPLGFLTMNEISQQGFLLKSIVVKNFERTTAKRNQKELWRYRALVSGFYVFKHEYLFLFQKQ